MELIVAPSDAGKRLDVVLKSAFPELSRVSLQRAIRDGACWSGSARLRDPAARLRSGQALVFEPPSAQAASIQPADTAASVIWHDSHLAVCAKPAGLTVHPCPSCGEETLAHRMLASFPELAAFGGERPGIVHRLDKDTSGLIIVALDETARLKLAEGFGERRISKEYLALVAGIAPETGVCAESLGRHPSVKTKMAVVPEKRGGRSARTEWRRLWHNDRISLLQVRIHTGRTHQIRVHLAHAGLPILGDKVYAPSQVSALAPRQMLHAWKLAFDHPLTGEALRFSLAPPPDFLATIMDLSCKMQPVVVTGNQGCGKSSFCRQLHDIGLPSISADEVVAELYARKSVATEWIGRYLGEEALNPDGSVNKPELFKLLQARADLRREFETAIHGLVWARIQQFWQENMGKAAAVAEIPLYFESNYQGRMEPAPVVVGVSCPESIRWQRIRENRGWSPEKIKTLEQWQWPEAKKMAACDLVIPNRGAAEDLKKEAAAFVEDLKQKREREKVELGERLHAIWAS